VPAGKTPRFSGPLYLAVSKARHLWKVIDIFGQFPPSILNALIGPEEVREAMAHHLQPFQIVATPKVSGADVARFGDGRSVICCRHGILKSLKGGTHDIDIDSLSNLIAKLATTPALHIRRASV